MFDCACQNKPTNYPLRQSPNPTVCHSVGITQFVLKKLNHEESADNTNAKIILHGWASAELSRNRVNVNLFLRHIRDLSR